MRAMEVLPILKEKVAFLSGKLVFILLWYCVKLRSYTQMASLGRLIAHCGALSLNSTLDRGPYTFDLSSHIH